MLTNRSPSKRCLLTFLGKALLSAGFMVGVACTASPAWAADAEKSFLPPMTLLLEPSSDKEYSYRKTQQDKTINLMLYGFKDPQSSGLSALIPKNRKALSSFFSEHLKRFKQDYLGPEDKSNAFRLVTGGDSFTSTPMNRGIQGDAAKMAGVTVPFGRFTLGGGYTWGEENPALMLKTADGLMLGASYDTGKVGFQTSYLTSGYKVGGFKVGGGNYKYNSLLFGTSFRVNDRMGLTATAQYRTDDDPLTTGKKQAIFTVGTRWRF